MIRGRLAAAIAGGVALALAAACGPPTSGVPVAELWAANCVRCHAQDGRGIPGQRALEPRLDLVASELVRGGERGLVYQRIAWGYAGMPGFSHKLEQGDLELLTQYVLDLAKE
jgi:mono/diheme cytochrome c family protein